MGFMIIHNLMTQIIRKLHLFTLQEVYSSILYELLYEVFIVT